MEERWRGRGREIGNKEGGYKLEGGGKLRGEERIQEILQKIHNFVAEMMSQCFD